MGQERGGFVQDDDLDVGPPQRRTQVGHESQPIGQHSGGPHAPVDEHGDVDITVGPRAVGRHGAEDVGRLNFSPPG